FEITGSDACEFLQYLAVANIDKAIGGAAYSQLCNARGGIEAEVTIIRRAQDRFWLMTGSALGIRDRHWIETNLRDYKGGSADVRLADISSAYGVINLAGPQARKVLEKICDTDVSHAGFPFMSAQDIRIGYAPALAYRVTYIGELGWELYIPTEYMQYAYEVLQAAGQEFGVCNTGYRAIDSLRLEKGYLAWGVDITPDYNPFEAGLQFLIDWNKGDFIGAKALAKIKTQGSARKLVCLALDKPLPVFGGEAIFADGKAIGQTTSGNYGYTVGQSLVLGYLPAELVDAGEFEVEAFGERSRATRIKGSAYDPDRLKILC
ncbi:MAG: aminomethyltransferase family protein, partial [Paracoccaceae bacterium]